MIGAFATVRVIVMLRRIWQSLNTITAIEQQRLELEQERLQLEYPNWQRRKDKPKQTQISTPTVDEWNVSYKEKHPFGD